VLLENRAKFVLVHCSSAHKGALREVLSSPVSSSQAAVVPWSHGLAR